jgi:4-carboxymuconolactone decarboxylase
VTRQKGQRDTRMTRQSTPDLTAFSPEQRAEYDRFTQTRKPAANGALGGPFDPWMTNAELFHRLTGLGGMLWARTSLDRGLVELAICITGRFWEANVEWAAHAPRAIEYGVAPAVLDEVLAGRRPKGRPEDELVYDLCQTMHETHALPRLLYDRGVAAFGERGVAELMAVIGYYTLVSMTLNAFEVQVGPGLTAPFERAP